MERGAEAVDPGTLTSVPAAGAAPPGPARSREDHAPRMMKPSDIMSRSRSAVGEGQDVERIIAMRHGGQGRPPSARTMPYSAARATIQR
jgi:hypothetical protein